MCREGGVGLVICGKSPGLTRTDWETLWSDETWVTAGRHRCTWVLGKAERIVGQAFYYRKGIPKEIRSPCFDDKGCQYLEVI